MSVNEKNISKRQSQAGMALLAIFGMTLIAKAQSYLVAGVLAMVVVVPLASLVVPHLAPLKHKRISFYLIYTATLFFAAFGALSPLMTITLLSLAAFLLCPRREALSLSLLAVAVCWVSRLVAEEGVSSEVSILALVNMVLVLIMNMLLRQIDQLKTRLEESLHVDPVTGVFNRQALIQELSKVYQLKERYGAVSTVVTLPLEADIASLAEHQFDGLVKDLVSLLRSRIRNTDLLYRSERDVFVLVLPATDPANAEALLQDLVRAAAVYQYSAPVSVELRPLLSASETSLSEAEWSESILSRES